MKATLCNNKKLYVINFSFIMPKNSTFTLLPSPIYTHSSCFDDFLLFLISYKELVTWIVTPVSNHQKLTWTSTTLVSIMFAFKLTTTTISLFFFFSSQFLNLKQSTCLWPILRQKLHFPLNFSLFASLEKQMHWRFLDLNALSSWTA